MKKFFSFLAIIAIFVVSNCSQIPENNDPVLGIWSKTQILQDESKTTNEKEEWIFNDAFLGRYQRYVDQHLVFYTDFSWTATEGVYTIIYQGTDIPTAEVLLNSEEQVERLKYTNGEVFAIRE